MTPKYKIVNNTATLKFISRDGESTLNKNVIMLSNAGLPNAAQTLSLEIVNAISGCT